ncbi:hypothetical protein CK203_034086 [Vitis vinifera]|uniref:Retrotransposon gag domain-containing protein n=1 Tax=Vitis vinifera TaxID=29760 RepID=A0A438IBB8_VITVI|nr:hypothetical protein CK203_034086 [Vitis vinifera]
MAGDGKKGDDGGSNSDEKMLTPYALTSNDNPSNIITQAQLKDLVNCKQEGQGIVVYYGRLKSLWDELNNYDSIPICTCTGCKCNITTQLEKKQEEERVHQFLMGLYEDGYETCRLVLKPKGGMEKTRLPRTTTGGHSGGVDMVQQGTGGGQGRGGTARANAVQTSETDCGLLQAAEGTEVGCSRGGRWDGVRSDLLRKIQNRKKKKKRRREIWGLFGGSKPEPRPYYVISQRAIPRSGTPKQILEKVKLSSWASAAVIVFDWNTRVFGTSSHGGLSPRYAPTFTLDRNLRMLIRASEQREGFIFSREWLLFVLTRQLVLRLMSSGIEEWVIPLLGAQQTREVLFSSDNKAKECFDLIHCDLWEAYRVPASCGGHHLFYWMVRHHMRSYTDKPPPISTFELLGVCAMPMTRIGIKTNLLVGAENVFLLGIRLERKSTRLATDGNTKVGDRGGTDVSRPMVSEEQFGKGKRVKQPFVRLKDYVTHTIRVSPSASSSFQSKSSRCEPSTYAEAIKDERWREAMRKEIHSLENNGTWTGENLPPGKKAIGSK